MKKKTRKVLMICILACAMFLTTAMSSFGLCAFADYIPEPQNTVYGPMYTPDYYVLGTDYVINGVHYGNGDYSIPSTVVLGERFNSRGYYVEGCQLALQKIHTFHPEINCWPGEADGIFGTITGDAVENFQSEVKIKADREVGKDTLHHLQERTFNQ